jgi:acyl-CoA thioesterase-1
LLPQVLLMGATRRSSKLGLTLPILLTLWLSACSSSSPQLPRLSENAVILAFGDSLTFGTGADQQHSYPAVLARLTGRKVINAGVPGEVSDAGLARLPGLLEQYSPELVILCHGGNDILRRHTPEQIASNLEAMARAAKARGIPVMLIGVPERGVFVPSAPFYEEVAKSLDIPLENRILATVLSTASLKADPVHPNADGYRRIAEAVYELLRDSGAM